MPGRREDLHLRLGRRRPRSRSPCRRARPRAASCGTSGASPTPRRLRAARRRSRSSRAGGSSASRMRSSAASSARARTCRIAASRACLIADLDQVADDRVDVAADVADLGELGRLDLDERRVGEPREPARDLGLADAGRADHQDVLRRDLLAQRLGDLLAPPAVAQRDRDRALGARPGRRCACRARGRSPAGSLRTCVGVHGDRASLQRLDDDVLVGVDAEVAGDGEALRTIVSASSSVFSSSARAAACA